MSTLIVPWNAFGIAGSYPSLMGAAAAGSRDPPHALLTQSLLSIKQA